MSRIIFVICFVSMLSGCLYHPNQPTLLNPCGGAEHHKHLSLGVGSSSTTDPTRLAGITTPPWGTTHRHLAGAAFGMSATFGLKDKKPRKDAFELFALIDGERVPVPMTYIPCIHSDGLTMSERHPSCARVMSPNGGCHNDKAFWITPNELDPSYDYILVHRIERGNGKPLQSAGPMVTLPDGEDAYTFKIELVER